MHSVHPPVPPQLDLESLQSLIGGLPESALLTLDQHGRLSQWGPSAERLTGYPAEAMLGRHLSCLHPPEDQAWGRVERQLQRALERACSPVEGWCLRQDGSRFWASEATLALHDTQGKHLGFAHLLTCRAEEAERSARPPQPLRARPQAESAEWRARLLDEATRALAECGLELDQALQTVSRCISEAMGDACVLTRVDRDGTILIAGFHHPDAEMREFLSKTLRGAYKREGGYVDSVVKTGQPLLMPVVQQAELKQRVTAQALPYLERFSLRSLVLVPMRLKGRVTGTIGLSRARQDEPYTLADQSLLQELADRAALFIENAQLFGAARAAEEELRRHLAQLQVLAEAWRSFVEVGPEFQPVLDTIAHQSSRLLGDACIISLLSEDGLWLEPAAHDHPEVVNRDYIRELMRAAPQRTTEGLAGQVLATGRSLLWHAEEILEMTKPEYRVYFERFNIVSTIIAPLRARGRILGVIGLNREQGRPVHTTEDLLFLEQLASRAALAIDNARLFSEARVAEARSRHNARRLHSLAEASRVLAEAGLDVHAAYRALIHFLAETLGDCCVLLLLDESGQSYAPVAWHHSAQSHSLSEIEVLNGRYPLGESLISRVLREGQSVLVSAIDSTDGISQPGQEFIRAVGVHSFVIAPVRAGGQILGALGLCRNTTDLAFSEEDRLLLEEVTARLALTLQNARHYEEAREAIQVRDDFLAVAGHELRTPLTSLQLQLELFHRSLSMASGELHAEALSHRLRAALRMARSLGARISGLLDVSRISSGRLVLEYKSLDLSSLVQEVASRFSEELRRVGSELRLELQPGVIGQWDEARLDQVISNLLSNAAKYGNGKPVELRLSASEERVCLQVRDQGIGIAPEDHARIFERFERAVSGMHYGGLGVGLWVTRQLVEAHAGLVSVHSTPHAGSTFTVELPRAPAPQARAAQGYGEQAAR